MKNIDYHCQWTGSYTMLNILKDFENASLVLLLLTLGIYDISAKIFFN